MNDSPLGLPTGSVRSILALSTVVGGLLFLGAMAILFEPQRDIIVGALIAIITLVLNAYFKMREAAQRNGD